MRYAKKTPFTAREGGSGNLIRIADRSSRRLNRTAGDRGWQSSEAPDTEPVVLIIDDDPNNLAIMSEFLQASNYTTLAAEDGDTGVKRAAYAQPDLILLDLMMPGMDGYQTCLRLKAQECTRDIPVICMTALAETENKLKGFQAGAVDYITKPYQREEVLARVDVHLRLRKLTRELQGARDLLELRVEERTSQLEASNRRLEREVAEHRETAEALRASEARFQAIFDNAFQFMGLLTPDGTLLATNRTSLAFCGLQESDVVNRPFWECPWWIHDPALQKQLRQAITEAAEGSFVRFEATQRSVDLSLHYFDFSIKPVRDEEGRVVLLIPEARDITDNRKLAEQLRQVQKMEAIGTLAGGIAHDFNNVLTAIMGFGGLLSLKLHEKDPLMDFVSEILAAADRAASLTGRLLSFSRKDIVVPGPVRLNEVVKRIDKLLLRIIGEDIEFCTDLHPGDLVVNSDSGHLDQVLMNLIANARDAMPNGGSIVIKTERVEMTDPYPGFLLEPGSYAVLSISDTGEGIDEQTRQRMFEPFYTTKEVGKGTGLGLSIVYGIIQQYHGQIEVCSDPGMGTTFKIFLRAIDSQVQKADPVRLPAPVGGTETILVAEDDCDVQRYMSQTLRDHGYKVIESGNGEEALCKFVQHQNEIDLVILDVVMPKMNGREVYRQICQSQRKVPVIFSSGYAAGIMSQKGILEEGIAYISKPMTPSGLLSKVRAALS